MRSADSDRLLLELGEGNDAVDQPPAFGRDGVVLLAEEPDLLGPLQADRAGQQPGPVAGVERPDLRTGLAEPGVVGGDREVAHQVEDVPAADRVARHHRDDRLGQPPDLHLEVEHVEAADPGGTASLAIAVVAADALVATGAEGLGPSPVSTITPIAGSSRASSKARVSSNSVWGGRRCGPRAG
jgi:hypothetical protein